MTPSSVQRLTDCFLSTQKYRVSLFSFFVLMSILALTAISFCCLAWREFAPPEHLQSLPLQDLPDAAAATTGERAQGEGELASWSWFLPKQVLHPEDHLVPGC